MYGSKFIDNRDPVIGREVQVEGLERPAVISQHGMTLFGRDGKKILISQLQLEDGRMIPATQWGKEEKTEKLELTEEEEKLRESIRVSNENIILVNIYIYVCVCINIEYMVWYIEYWSSRGSNRFL